MLRIGLVQMRCEKAAVTANLRCMSRYIVEADRRGIDILGFPEMNITGYADPTRYPEAIVRLDGPEMDVVLEMTKGRKSSLLAGVIEHNPAGKPFVTQVVVRGGQLIGYYRKKTIKDEEADWFTPGENVSVFNHDNLCFGVAVCADIDDETVFAEAAGQGALIVFELAAPGLYGEQATRDWRSGFQWWQGKCHEQLSVYAVKYGIWIAVATQAGRTVDEDFPGGGYVFAPDGRQVYATPDWFPGAVYLGLDFKEYSVVHQ